MSYLLQAELASDELIMRRVTACAASEGFAQPDSWAWERRWRLSAQPGWVDAYASAHAANFPAPGADQAVISDAQILSAVQQLAAEDAQ